MFGAYSIGKEKIYMAVADMLNCKIHVEPSRMNYLQCYQDNYWTKELLEKRFTTDITQPDIKIFVRNMNTINFAYIKKLKETLWSIRYKNNMHNNNTVMNNKNIRVIAFLPTGWSHNKDNNTTTNNNSDNINKTNNNNNNNDDDDDAIASHMMFFTNNTNNNIHNEIFSKTTTVEINNNHHHICDSNNSSSTISSTTTTTQITKEEYIDLSLLGTMRTYNDDIIYSIPYSEHSSFTELIDFIRVFRPHMIIPTVNTSTAGQVEKQLRILQEASRTQKSFKY